MDKNNKFDVVQKKIMSIISKNLNADNEEKVNDEISLENYAINSIDALEMLILIEKEFHIEIDDDDLNAELFTDITYLTNYVLDSVSDDYFD